MLACVKARSRSTLTRELHFVSVLGVLRAYEFLGSFGTDTRRMSRDQTSNGYLSLKIFHVMPFFQD